MENLTLEATFKTPLIQLNVNGNFSIKGRSIPENSLKFYRPVFDWLLAYTRSPLPVTNFDISLEYFSSSTSKCLLNIFKLLERVQNKGFTVNINWYYIKEDTDMLDAGQDFSSYLTLNFSFIKE